MAFPKSTLDHAQIRRWAEARGGRPARLRRPDDAADPGTLRIDFPGYTGFHILEEISWEIFFAVFEEEQLELIYQETTASGEPSFFSKFVRREQAERRRAVG